MAEAELNQRSYDSYALVYKSFDDANKPENLYVVLLQVSVSLHVILCCVRPQGQSSFEKAACHIHKM